MIDWHSHVLCGIDDGAKTPSESIAMLRALYESGVDTVCATPHFYADAVTLDEFLEKRAEASGKIAAAAADEELPRLLLGAEVRYYSGICRMEGLGSLCIDKTNVLLLEMPFCRWTEYVLGELCYLAGAAPFSVVLAHVERYQKLQEKKTWQRLYEAGVLSQVNASYFNSRMTRGRALRMLTSDRIHFIGSDCHNMSTRAPNLAEAYGIIRKRLGADLRDEVDAFGYSLIRADE